MLLLLPFKLQITNYKLPFKMPRLTARHYLAYILLCAIWGSTWMAIRVVVRDIPPMLAAGLRFIIAALILLIIAALNRLSLKMPRAARDWRRLREDDSVADVPEQ